MSGRPIDISAYDFLDIGCSSGGSITYAKRHLGGKRPLGIDIDPDKVAKAKALGHDAVVADATRLPELRGHVRFVIMSHFLEHLPPGNAAEQSIRGALRKANGFVYIQQPWFDADEDLARKGLKLFWSDWSGHPNRMRADELIAIGDRAIRAGEAVRCLVWGYGLILDSDDPAVHPLGSPRNQHNWEPSRHGAKPKVTFTSRVHKELRMVAAVRDPAIANDVLQRTKGTTLLWDSAQPNRNRAVPILREPTT